MTENSLHAQGKALIALLLIEIQNALYRGDAEAVEELNTRLNEVKETLPEPR